MKPGRRTDVQAEREAYFWAELLKRGPAALVEARLAEVERHLSWKDGANEEGRAALRMFFDDVAEQTAWIVEARKELISETARVRELGIVMQKAGLRSYTDREGRIYVAATVTP